MQAATSRTLLQMRYHGVTRLIEPYALAFKFRVSDGVYTVRYFSVDNAGNAEAVKTAGTAIHVDRTSPAPAALSLPAAIRNGQTLTDAATDPTVNGATSGVSSVAYYECPGAACSPATLVGSSTAGPSYPVTWSSQPADGAYRVQAVVTDGAGNTASSGIVSTTVDNTPPTGGSVSYTNGYFTAASIPVSFTKNGTSLTNRGVTSARTKGGSGVIKPPFGAPISAGVPVHSTVERVTTRR